MFFPIHPDDIPSPRFGCWSDDFNTYSDACAYYGADDPEVLAQEDEDFGKECVVQRLDEMEARGGPAYDFRWYPFAATLADDEIPF